MCTFNTTAVVLVCHACDTSSLVRIETDRDLDSACEAFARSHFLPCLAVRYGEMSHQPDCHETNTHAMIRECD